MLDSAFGTHKQWSKCTTPSWLALYSIQFICNCEGAEVISEVQNEYVILQNNASSKGTQFFFPGMLPGSKKQKKKKASVKIKRAINKKKFRGLVGW